MNGRRLCCCLRWRRPAVAVALVAFMLSLLTAAASTSGSRANGSGDWGAGRDVSGRQGRSLVPYPLLRGSSSRDNGRGDR